MSNPDTFASLVQRSVQLANDLLTAAGTDKAMLTSANRAIRQARTVRIRTVYVDPTGHTLPATAGVDIVAVQEAIDGGLLAPVTPKAATPKAATPKAATPKAATLAA